MKIGLILPGSNILPAMGKDFRKGFELAIKEEQLPDFEIYPAFVNQGSKNDVQKACEKLILYDDIDVVAGIISNRVSLHLADYFQNKKTPLLISNLGENIFAKHLPSDQYYVNSMHLWKSQWALGNWAQKKYGGNLSICMTIYDAGYHMHEAFRLGSVFGGGDAAHLNILKVHPGLVNTESLIESIAQQKPNHVHAVLCGKDAFDFWKRYKKAGYLGKIPLTVSPFFFDSFEQADENSVEVYSASSWVNVPDRKNETFFNEYIRNYKLKPGVFSILGYESGLLLAQAGNNSQCDEGITDCLRRSRITGPSGEVSYDLVSSANQLKIWLKEHQLTKDGEISEVCIETIPGPGFEDPGLQKISFSGISGWQNPYLCI